MNRYYQKNKYISFLDMIENDENIWVANNCFNGIFRMRKDGTMIEHIASFDKDVVLESGTGLYFQTIFYNNSIVFLPHNTFKVAIFSLDTKTLKYIQMPCSVGTGGYVTAGYALYKGSLYLFSQFAQCRAVRIHMETFVVEELEIWDELASKYYDEDTRYMIDSAIQIDDYVWIGIKKTNKIIGYSLRDRSCNQLESEKEIVKVFGNAGLHEIYNVSTDGKSVECIALKEQGKRSHINLDSFIEKGNRILYILSDEKNFIMIPFYGKYIIIVDRKSGAIKKHQDFPKEFDNFSENERYFYTGRLTEEFIELFPYYTNGMIRIHRQSGETKLYKTEIEWEDSIDSLVLKYHYRNSIKNTICFERVYSVSGFLDMVTRDGDLEGKGSSNKKNGEKIAQYVLHGED